MNTFQKFLHELANEGDLIARHYHQKRNFDVSTKSNTSPVTQADLEIEAKIRGIAQSKYPEMALVGEEYPPVETSSGYKLIIDPLDGTSSFTRGIPFFATLLGIEYNGEIIEGLVSAPVTKDRWWASKGEGAYYNGERIYTSKIDSLAQAQAFHPGLYGYESTGCPPTWQKLLSQTKRQRGYGDYLSPMLVAMGCGEYSFDFNIQPWDMAPMMIILQEAGGQLTDLSGNKTIYSNHMICSNGAIHQTVLDILNGKG